MKPKILLLDIENSPNTVLAWDGMYENDIIAVEEYGQMLSFAWKWLGESSVNVLTQNNFTGNRERKLLSELHKLLCEADVVIAHNGDNFDIKKTNAYLIKYGFTPPSPFRTVDTYKIAKSKFRFNSNRLDELGHYLGIGRKVHTGGFPLWRACMDNVQEAWKKMAKYNKQDIVLLEKVYTEFLPWITNHPNVNALNGKKLSCPNCSSNKIQMRGFSMTTKGKKQRYQCQICGGWSTDSQIIKK